MGLGRIVVHLILVLSVTVGTIFGVLQAFSKLEVYEESFYLANFSQIEVDLKEHIEGEIIKVEYKRDGTLFLRESPTYEVHTDKKSYKVDIPTQNLLYSPFFYKNDYKNEHIKILRITEMNRVITTR